MNTASASATDRVKLLGVGCELTAKQPFGCRRRFLRRKLRAETAAGDARRVREAAHHRRELPDAVVTAPLKRIGLAEPARRPQRLRRQDGAWRCPPQPIGRSPDALRPLRAFRLVPSSGGRGGCGHWKGPPARLDRCELDVSPGSKRVPTSVYQLRGGGCRSRTPAT